MLRRGRITQLKRTTRTVVFSLGTCLFLYLIFYFEVHAGFLIYFSGVPQFPPYKTWAKTKFPSILLKSANTSFNSIASVREQVSLLKTQSKELLQASPSVFAFAAARALEIVTRKDEDVVVSEWEKVIKKASENAKILHQLQNYLESESKTFRSSPKFKKSEEKRMSVCYLILLHNNELFLGARRLIEQLYENHHLFLLLLDKKVGHSLMLSAIDWILKKREQDTSQIDPNEDDEIVKQIQHFRRKRNAQQGDWRNVFARRAPDMSRWANVSLITNSYYGFQKLWSLSADPELRNTIGDSPTDGTQCEYFTFLSGDSFPLVSNLEIERRMEKHKGESAVTLLGYLPHLYPNRHEERASRGPPEAFEAWQFGSQWVTLHESFMRYTLFSNTSISLLRYMKEMDFIVADESYYQTLFHHFIALPLASSTHTRKAIMAQRKTNEFAPLCRLEHWTGGNHPLILDHNDVEINRQLELDASQRCLFGRKFRSSISHSLLSTLSEKLN